jgi:hypothetical protein
MCQVYFGLSLSLSRSLARTERDSLGPERSRVWVWKMFQAFLSSWACNRRATVGKYDRKIHINKIECVFSGLHWLLMSVFSKKMLCMFIYIYNYIHMYVYQYIIYICIICIYIYIWTWWQPYDTGLIFTCLLTLLMPGRRRQQTPDLHCHNGLITAMGHAQRWQEAWLCFFLELGWRESMFGWCCSFIWILIDNDWYLIGYSGIVIFLTLIFR